MTILPVVERELRVASRRASTFRYRFWAGLCAMAMAAWMLFFVAQHMRPSEAARVLFYGLTSMTLMWCLLAGLHYTAGSMTEEKREGTLGLLFLTDLKGHDVVLGKLVANSIHGCCALLAMLPVMTLPLLLGSFTFGDVARTALALINSLFFSLCVGMYASTVSRTTRGALGMALGLVAVFSLGMPWLAGKLAQRWPGSDLAGLLAALSPGVSYVLAITQKFPLMPTPGGFWLSLGLVHAVSWLVLLRACRCAPNCWQDQPGMDAESRVAAGWLLRISGRRARERARRRRMLDRNPFYWRASRARFAPLAVWVALGVGAAIWLWGWTKYPADWVNAGTYVLTALMFNALLKLGVATEATRPLVEERRDGTLELLLSTSLSVREILRGQALALRRVFLGPLVVSLIVCLVMMVAGLGELRLEERRGWLVGWVAGLLMLGADLVALYWVGMWRAVAARNPKFAFGQTVWCVLIAPWVGTIGFLTLVELLSRGIFGVDGWAILAAWIGFGLLADVGLGLWARQKLLREFRLRASERYVAPVRWWRVGGVARGAAPPVSAGG